ncbi:ABC transporter ATP-binding protein [Frigoribacterium sp. VKM Ac-2530]|uniref:ABC transporter ATP-binding protein n=1 Tax=Frigoribacterium sp. VKM Ac-2530 TaxID=2783822 RepID=UPI00188BF3C2|nr:ABC transporter ATP-binding protein [Frigoribacterium sp. VKM Ac-2530]MBF4579506.1 ABC transporter ATP-binding protein [Frigoribacterium sp. VKM Ac-2530]
MTQIDVRSIEMLRQTGGQQTRILAGVDLSVSPGEFVALEGPSGAGKTSLLSCLAGLDRPTRGVVALDGVDLRTLSPRRLADLRSHSVGLIQQHDNVFSSLSVAENVELPARIRRGRLTRSEIGAALDAVGLRDRAKARPAELSGGERQRVAVARCIANRARLILADEPTESLDRANARQVIALLRDQAARGCTVVMVTHDGEAAAAASRRVRLEQGQIVSDLR